ncbi:hypothetical protein BESB_017370 [Besnoitia besnoiti]|uniref:Cytochrome C family oxidase subunit II, transmembrane domain protein n=1 Tax=Besnoitia besnoiti TaxID=94643 RepID=A0A2A9M3A4_BESBE|nr:hypothetical protein BESB_017370 [Besnoitia besnoiti]PFH32419.1 hypothetical protein BESB_017370 [Besnoitia besnoiti]
MARSPQERAPAAPSTMPVRDVFSSFFARRFSTNAAPSAPVLETGSPLRRIRTGAPVRNDHPENWRMFMGGHDPASPMAEGLINVHNHNVMWMIFVVSCVMWPLKCRI